MLRFLMVLICPLLIGSCAYPTDRARPPRTDTATTPFRAMTFNIRYGTARDGDDDWAHRRDLVADAIAQEAPHILGVQEALAFQLEFLAVRLPHHRMLGQGRDGGERGEYSALFIDERTFEVVDHGDFWLSDTPDVTASVGWDAALTRMCTWARVRSRNTGSELLVWNTHFDHRGREARRESAKLIARRIGESRGPHLVMGDLNTGEDSAPLQTLRGAGLRDTFRDVHPEATSVGTFHGFRGGTAGSKIDFVLAGPGLTTIAAAILTEPGANGRWPSDHHPVTASLLL